MMLNHCETATNPIATTNLTECTWTDHLPLLMHKDQFSICSNLFDSLTVSDFSYIAFLGSRL